MDSSPRVRGWQLSLYQTTNRYQNVQYLTHNFVINTHNIFLSMSINAILMQIQSTQKYMLVIKAAWMLKSKCISKFLLNLFEGDSSFLRRLQFQSLIF
ncbi:hypothetical protein FGO68_gene9913 [Halteria grandinella]|uniref:Uncharacterized protein n=1 Tax=Halteria grandinella TaxID=5974 RepID=A0A8J8P376_HALGN|nr:hypothetical protein FGO68_gene9913 [Halteria grandinella]